MFLERFVNVKGQPRLLASQSGHSVLCVLAILAESSREFVFGAMAPKKLGLARGVCCLECGATAARAGP